MRIVLLLLFAAIHATTLSYRLAPHERACFFVDTKQLSEKLSFYFAVQHGGNFDVDFDITSPSSRMLLNGVAARDGDYVLTAEEIGEYSVCFSNTMSTFAEKSLDFDITAQHELIGSTVSTLEEAVGTINPMKQKPVDVGSGVTKRIEEVGSRLNGLYREQRKVRTREQRNRDTVDKTGMRIFLFALLECAVIVGCGVGQVYLIETFFKKNMRTRV